MFGWVYVIETCISLFQKEKENRAYQIYVTECLRIITENTAKTAALMVGNGDEEIRYITASFEDMLNPKPRDERTAEEIISDIKTKLQKIGGEPN